MSEQFPTKLLYSLDGRKVSRSITHVKKDWKSELADSLYTLAVFDSVDSVGLCMAGCDSLAMGEHTAYSMASQVVPEFGTAGRLRAVPDYLHWAAQLAMSLVDSGGPLWTTSTNTNNTTRMKKVIFIGYGCIRLSTFFWDCKIVFSVKNARFDHLFWLGWGNFRIWQEHKYDSNLTTPNSTVFKDLKF